MRCKLANEDRKKYVDINVSEKRLPLCVKMLVSDLYTDK